MKIRRLSKAETPPMDILMLADPSRDIIEKYLIRGECYVAEIDHQLAGVYVLLPTRPETVELVNIAVAEQLQGKGLGKKLVNDAIRKAKLEGYKTIEVGTGNSSIEQLSLYQKCGFRMVGVDIDFFTRHYPEKIIENGIHCRDMIRLARVL